MKVKLNEELKGVDGIEILKNDKGRPITLRDVCINSVLSPMEGDDDRKKFERYEIFKKIRDTEDCVLSSEEITTLKKTIAKHNPPLIMGQCWDLLEDNVI